MIAYLECTYGRTTNRSLHVVYLVIIFYQRPDLILYGTLFYVPIHAIKALYPSISTLLCGLIFVIIRYIGSQISHLIQLFHGTKISKRVYFVCQKMESKAKNIPFNINKAKMELKSRCGAVYPRREIDCLQM